MKQYLVVYYSKTGNSKFLAKKMAERLAADSIAVKPMVKQLFWLFLLSSLKIRIPTNISPKVLQKCESVVVFGPIWGGLLISPLRSVMRDCVRADKPIHLALSCETDDAHKDDKYGYAGVLEEAKQVGGKLVKTTAAFPTSLVMEKDASWSPKLSEKVKITEQNYQGAIQERIERFISDVRAGAAIPGQ